MHGQEWQAQSQVCEDAWVRLSHFVDEELSYHIASLVSLYGKNFLIQLALN
jgi:hypothetical protein